MKLNEGVGPERDELVELVTGGVVVLLNLLYGGRAGCCGNGFICPEDIRSIELLVLFGRGGSGFP